MSVAILEHYVHASHNILSLIISVKRYISSKDERQFLDYNTKKEQSTYQQQSSFQHN